jgi:hypothetical protein
MDAEKSFFYLAVRSHQLKGFCSKDKVFDGFHRNQGILTLIPWCEVSNPIAVFRLDQKKNLLL